MPADGAGYYIGVDLGGSRTKIGISDRSGDILARRSVPTRGEEGPGPVVREIARAVDGWSRRQSLPVLPCRVSASDRPDLSIRSAG